MKTAFASFLLWVSSIALLGGVALACAIMARVAAEMPPVHPAAIQIGRMDPGPAQFCPTPMPVRPQQPKETQV